MSFDLKQELNFNSQALKLRAQRHEIIAGNLANAETPNYKAKDFRFGDALKQATGMPTGDVEAVSNVKLALTDSNHIKGQADLGLPTQLLYRTPAQAAIDGNTVDPDLERSEFTDNALKYDATLRMINGQIRSMQTAIDPGR